MAYGNSDGKEAEYCCGMIKAGMMSMAKQLFL